MPDPLGRLRSLRNRPDRARGIGDDLQMQMNTMKKISATEQAASDAWAVAVPDGIRESTQIAGIKGGKLVVLVPSGAHRHVVDRWLGSGGLGEFQALARVPIGGVVLKIAPKADANG
jgi:hypothetical protein